MEAKTREAILAYEKSKTLDETLYPQAFRNYLSDKAIERLIAELDEYEAPYLDSSILEQLDPVAPPES